MKPVEAVSADLSCHAARRARLIAAMGEGVAVLPTAAERLRNRDSHFPYRYDSYFYYLSGFAEPEAVLVLVAGKEPRSILFCRTRDPEREIWDGFRYGPEAARERFGFDEGHPVAELDEALPRLLENQPALYFPLGADAEWDARAMRWLNAVRARSRAGVAAPQRVQDLRALLDDMRLIKDELELGVMRRAARIAAAAHRRAMQTTRPGRHEFEIEAELLYEFRRNGAQFPAYTPIVAGGANACVLHYVANDAPLRDGALLLIDAGCELDGYASDITRTFPVNGRFSGAQRAVYELVLEAQRAAIAAVRPGAAWNAPHDAAVRVLAQGMLDLKLLSGTLEEVLEKESYRRFYMHRTGHWLGLDVHDAGEYRVAGEWRPLAPGMALTVEPGLYIRAADDVPPALADIGVRIEDDVVVTAQGCEVITAEAPKRVADVEALMRDARVRG
ncbi:MAG TPA: aminopeptidase P N-terminal domain-containing protein [Burkholderiales bacterium]|nr:aminopeptidase P N-terminal domain-containing protein [Burkholderiales bacterium]